MKTQIKSRYNPWKLLLVVLMLLPSMLEAQYIYNMNPDSVFHDGEDYRWFPNETVMYGFQGTIFVFTCEYIEDGVTVTVYTIDHNGKLSAYKMLPGNVNYFTYGFPDELEWYQGMQGNAIAFEYNGEMWHYYNQKAKSTLTHSTDDSYDCFAHMPANSTAQAHGYYDLISGKIKIIKKTAFQHDSCLYFLGVYAQSDDPNYDKWCVQKYAYDKPNDKFIWKWNHLIADIEADARGLDLFPRSLFTLSLQTVTNILDGALQQHNASDTATAEGTASSDTLLHFLRSLQLDKAEDRLRLLDEFRRQRAAGLYDGSFAPSEAEVEAILDTVADLKQHLEQWLQAQHPELI